MRFHPTALPEVIVLEPEVYKDNRGFFLESYHARKYREGGIPALFVQDNHSRSIGGTIRGLHAQRQHPQGKLVRVLAGEIFDVAVDVRCGSPSFGRWVGMTLSAENFLQVYVPPGFVHGFAVISPVAEIEYKCTDFYDPTDELSILWNDPDIGIDWPVREPILSAKDQAAHRLADVMSLLPVWVQGLNWGDKHTS
jgi:dTDP-4-dehydrorhamnose 3,5-epimerase